MTRHDPPTAQSLAHRPPLSRHDPSAPGFSPSLGGYPGWEPLRELTSAASRDELAREVAKHIPLAASIRAKTLSKDRALQELVRLGGRARISQLHARLWIMGGASAKAGDFFLNDIYPAKAPAWRDGQALSAMGSMARLLPMPALMALARAARLDAATEAIDRRVGEILQAQGWPKSSPALDAESDAFKKAFQDAHGSLGMAPRSEQIMELMAVADALMACASFPLASQALRAMSFPARLAGLSDLQGFLERGLAAFKGLADPQDFCRQLGARELAALGDQEPRLESGA